MSGVSRMPSNESVIPTVSVSAITKLNGKIGVVGIYLVLFSYSPALYNLFSFCVCPECLFSMYYVQFLSFNLIFSSFSVCIVVNIDSI